MKSLLAAALAVTLAGVQEKTYDLRLDWTPVKGYRAELNETHEMKMSITATGMGQLATQSERSAFAALETIVSADSEGFGDRSWAFSQATQEKDGTLRPLGFSGKTVRVSNLKGKPRTFAVEDHTVLSPDDVAVLKSAFMGSTEAEREPGALSGREVLAPKHPVKIGESWNPDLVSISKGMLNKEMAGGLDLQKSKAVFTLKRVERRDGVDYGTIEGVMELSVNQIGPMKLETPMMFRINMTMDGCIDGQLPDGVLGMGIEMKGTSKVASPNGELELTFDMTAAGKKTVRTVK